MCERKAESVSRFAGRNGIVSEASPRMAPAQAANAQPGTANTAMGFHGFKEVLGTGGFEPATRTGTGDRVQHRRYQSLIELDQSDKDPLHSGLGEACSFAASSPVLRARRSQSRRRSSKLASPTLYRPFFYSPSTPWAPSKLSKYCLRGKPPA